MTMARPNSRHELRADIQIDIEATFTAKIEICAAPDIAIDRQLHMRRDPGGEWFMYSIPTGAVEVAGDIASGDISVSDPAINAFLDSFFCLLSDPESFGAEEFKASESIPVSTEGT